MFTKIGEEYLATKDPWVKRCERYAKLELFDRLLAGTFYDHLQFAYYEETESRKYIPITSRRPSARFNLPRFVGRQLARKLFMGRHAPKLRHKDDEVAAAIRKLVRNGKMMSVLASAVLMGSVGAVAVTFRVDKADGDEDPQISFSHWHAKDCAPQFDRSNELAKLRVQYLTTGASLKAMKDPPASIDAAKLYWFVRDYTTDEEITYQPVEKADWNPVDGFTDKNKDFVRWDGECTKHDFGFVPGHWFVNLTGGCLPDGACTFEDAIPNTIEIDYTLSQIGRGVRYNAAPLTVVIGEILTGASPVGDTATILQLQGGTKEDDFTKMAGDAKLLEMAGTGIEASLKLIEYLRNGALEQICASRKDPEKMKGPLSGRAMEYLDEDMGDLVMELRTQYGDRGFLPLVRKVARACDIKKDLGSLSLLWPRLFQPTPMELAQVIPALVQAVYPQTKAQGVRGTSGAGGSSTSPAAPPVQLPGLLSLEEAQNWLRLNMDIDMVQDESEVPEEQDVLEVDIPEPLHGPARVEPDPLPEDAPIVPGGIEIEQPEGGIGGPVNIDL